MRESFQSLGAVLATLGLLVTACSGTPEPSSSALPGTAANETGLVATTQPPVGIDAEPGLGDDFYPQLGNAGYDVEHVNLDLRIDPDACRGSKESPRSRRSPSSIWTVGLWTSRS